MVLHYRNLRGRGSLWVLSSIFHLLARIFFRLFMYSVSLSVLPPQHIMRGYFMCFVISEAPFLDHCYTVLICHFLFGPILMLDGLIILTHTAPQQASVFSWAPPSFFGVASAKMLTLTQASRLNIVLWLILL